MVKNNFRIAMIAACPLPYPRGTPIRIYNMACALAEQGCHVHLITYHLSHKSASENSNNSLKIHRIPIIPTYNKLSAGPSYQKLLIVDFFVLIKLLKVLRRYDFDIIHAHHYEGLLISLMAKFRNKLPIIYDAHTLLGSELHHYAINMPIQIKKKIGRVFDSKLPGHADHVIAVTEDIKDKLVKQGSVKQEKISVVMNGAEIEHFRDDRHFNSFSNSSKKLIYTGNLGKHQGIEHLLHIFAKILEFRKDVRLIIVTNDSFKNYYPLASKLGVKPFIDIVESDFSKLPLIIHSSHIMINPRIECDGVPQKLLNYMASGKPIVSFKGSAKILDHNQTGIVIEDYNYEEFAKGVIYLINHYEIAKKIGKNAQNLINQDFTWKSKSKQVIGIYKNVLEKF